jgi:hypothetical protein
VPWDLSTSQKTLLTKCSSLSLKLCKTLHNLKSNCKMFLEKTMQSQIRDNCATTTITTTSKRRLERSSCWRRWVLQCVVSKLGMGDAETGKCEMVFVWKWSSSQQKCKFYSDENSVQFGQFLVCLLLFEQLFTNVTMLHFWVNSTEFFLIYKIKKQNWHQLLHTEFSEPITCNLYSSIKWKETYWKTWIFKQFQNYLWIYQVYK